jgi:hypothetical protein
MTTRFKITDTGVVRVDESHIKAGDGKQDPKTCDHDKYEWVHEYDEDSILGDWYWCSGCGEHTQSG